MAARATRITLPPRIFWMSVSDIPRCTMPTVNIGQFVQARLGCEPLSNAPGGQNDS